jgi:hypothetical protein
MLAKVFSCAVIGPEQAIIQVEVDISRSLDNSLVLTPRRCLLTGPSMVTDREFYSEKATPSTRSMTKSRAPGTLR